MALEISCPLCDEEDDLTGERSGEQIHIACHSCGESWTRDLSPRCPRCDGAQMQTVPLAIVEKSRGTQLSVVGIRMIQLCRICDRPTIDRWQVNRPNPLMPAELPNLDSVDLK